MNVTGHRIAANVFFVLHCAASAFALFGIILVVINKAWMWLHVPLVIWFGLMNLADWTCPLTTWEKALRQRIAQPYSEGFIRHYLRPIVDANGDPRRLEIIVGATILLWNAVLYGALYAFRSL